MANRRLVWAFIALVQGLMWADLAGCADSDTSRMQQASADPRDQDRLCGRWSIIEQVWWQNEPEERASRCTEVEHIEIERAGPILKIFIVADADGHGAAGGGGSVLLKGERFGKGTLTAQGRRIGGSWGSNTTFWRGLLSEDGRSMELRTYTAGDSSSGVAPYCERYSLRRVESDGT